MLFYMLSSGSSAIQPLAPFLFPRHEIITSLFDQQGASFELSAKTNRIMLSVTSRFFSPGTKCEEKKTACGLRLSLLRKLE